MIGAKARRSYIPQVLSSLAILLNIISATSLAEINLPQADSSELTLPEPAQRIVTLAPNLAELVFAAGAGEKLLAVVEYSNFPAAVKMLPRVGDAFRIDLERIIELDPDLIIAWNSGNPQTALKKLEQLGFVVWQIEIALPDDIPDILHSIAMAAGTENIGRPASEQLRSRLSQLRQDNVNKVPLEYFFQIAAQPLYTINSQHIISRSLEMCGGVNIFSELQALAPQVSRESVILANPQVMIATEIEGQPPSLGAWLEWPKLQAVEHRALFYLPADEISQATPRLLDSIELACKLLDQVRHKTIKKLH